MVKIEASKPDAIVNAETYVSILLYIFLSEKYIFHDIRHTKQVVEAVKEIGQYMKLSREEIEIVEMAAWFHDLGHIGSYEGHEIESCKLAYRFLKNHSWPPLKIRLVTNCILKTKMPQAPSNILEAVLCDADLHHLSQPDFRNWNKKLRKEWELILNQKYTNKEWEKMNLRFLESHKYNTVFGKKKLERKKLDNIKYYQLDN